MRGNHKQQVRWRVDAIGGTVCLAMCLCTYLLGIQPLLAQHERLAQQRVQLSAQQARAAESAATLQNVKNDLAIVRQKLATRPLRLQPAQQVNQRLSLVTSLANDMGARVDDLQPGRVSPGTLFDTIAIRLIATGTYTNCTALLHKLRQALPDTGVAGLEVSGRPTDPMGQAKFQFDLIWYTAPTSRAMAATDLGK